MPYFKPKPPTAAPASPRAASQPQALPISDSPPASPVSTAPPISDDEHLSDLSNSWLEVEGSSVGPSVLGDVFSDTSSDSPDHEHDARSHWSASTDEDRESDADDVDAIIISSTDPDSLSLAGGPYTDAEASTTKLDSSTGTIQRGLASTASSQIRLIFPDPGASFSTSSGTFSAGLTPNASIGGLTSLTLSDQASRPRAGTQEQTSGSNPTSLAVKLSPRRSSSPATRGVEDSWLRSSKLWVPLRDGSRNPATEEVHEYKLLSSIDGSDLGSHTSDDDQLLQMPRVDIGGEDTAIGISSGSQNITKDQTFPVTFDWVWDQDPFEEEPHSEHVSVSGNSSQIKTATRTWSKRVSFLALASVLSLALFRTFGSGAFDKLPYLKYVFNAERHIDGVSESSLPQTNGASPLWDSLTLSSTRSEQLHAPIETSPRKGDHPDIKIIKHALSTLSNFQDKLSSVASRSPVSSQAPDHTVTRDLAQPAIRPGGSCRSVALRNDKVALIVANAHPREHRSFAKKFTDKLLGHPMPDEPSLRAVDPNQARPVQCSCEVSVMSDLALRITTTFDSAQRTASAIVCSFQHHFNPVLRSLERDFGIIWAMSHSASQDALARAVRGATIATKLARNAYLRAIQGVSALVKSTSHSIRSTSADEAARAQALIESLSEYIEDRFDSLSELIEEQAEAMHERSVDSIHKAKQGLNRLLREAKMLQSGTQQAGAAATSSDVGNDGPLPFAHMSRMWRLGRQTVRGESRPRWSDQGRSQRRGQRRHERTLGKQRLMGKAVRLPPPEKPSLKRFMDAVHHGAMAFVI
ncbi:hypothetical protein IAU60_002741 [Kwoniella sp. DSM 27419]